jgi:hypothetical protein
MSGLDEDRFSAELRDMIESAGPAFLPARDAPGISGADLGDPVVRARFFETCAWVQKQFDGLRSADPIGGSSALPSE